MGVENTFGHSESELTNTLTLGVHVQREVAINRPPLSEVTTIASLALRHPYVSQCVGDQEALGWEVLCWQQLQGERHAVLQQDTGRKHDRPSGGASLQGRAQLRWRCSNRADGAVYPLTRSQPRLACSPKKKWLPFHVRQKVSAHFPILLFFLHFPFGPSQWLHCIDSEQLRTVQHTLHLAHSLAIDSRFDRSHSRCMYL